MKKKDKSAERDKSKEELMALVKKIQSELVKMRIDQTTGKIMNHQLRKNKKKKLAFLKTILAEKENNEAV